MIWILENAVFRHSLYFIHNLTLMLAVFQFFVKLILNRTWMLCGDLKTDVFTLPFRTSNPLHGASAVALVDITKRKLRYRRQRTRKTVGTTMTEKNTTGRQETTRQKMTMTRQFTVFLNNFLFHPILTIWIHLKCSKQQHYLTRRVQWKCKIQVIDNGPDGEWFDS
jgi:hypothetical protein